MQNKEKLKSVVFVILLLLVVFSNMSYNSPFFNQMISIGSADEQHANNDSSWHNSSWLNVTIESKYPRILWYDFQKCTDSNFDGGWTETIDEGSKWVSKRNNMT